ncbi:MAG: hypothetical protein IJK54_01610 [Clostridia bacterium]|nr:hypothetical protein [Clostridia bacterium]
MKQRRSGWTRIITLLLVLALLGGGAYYLYQRDFGGSKETAYVQSVSAIIGSGSVGLYAQYNGIVEAKDVIEVNPNGSMPIKECYVSAGSKIREGEPLFCYDVDDLELQYAQIEIDISGVENNLRTYREQLSALNTKLKKAKEDERYAIELDIQTVELDIRKAEFDLEDKHRRADEMQAVIDASEVLSPVTGTVRSVRDSSGSSDPFGYGYGDSSSAYITIIAGTAFCVKGSVNEQTIYTLYVGMPVLIRSRVNDRVLHGTIYRIDTESPESSQSAMYYYGGGGESASKYAFYVEPESIEGLMIGQHVVIDLNTDTDTSTALMLPAAFLFEENGSYYAWAADADGRIEKRAVTVGAYDEETECWEILEGLARRDRIAFPDETIHVGMLATETAFADSGDNGGMTAIPDGGMTGTWDTANDGEPGAWDTANDGDPGAWDTANDGTDTVTFGG